MITDMHLGSVAPNTLTMPLRLANNKASGKTKKTADVTERQVRHTCSTTMMMKSSSCERRKGWRWLMNVLRCWSLSRNGTMTATLWRGMHHSGIHRPPRISWWRCGVAVFWRSSWKRWEDGSRWDDDVWASSTSFHVIFTARLICIVVSTNSHVFLTHLLSPPLSLISFRQYSSSRSFLDWISADKYRKFSWRKLEQWRRASTS